MATVSEDRHTLVSSDSWRATPDDYSSMRLFRLHADGCGELIYAYGQTIYAVIPCAWVVPTAGRLQLTFATPTRGRLAAGFVLDDDNRIKEVGYILTAGQGAGVQDVVPNPYQYDWTLELSEPPWPAGLALPYEVPRVFYGRVALASQADDEPGAGGDDRVIKAD